MFISVSMQMDDSDLAALHLQAARRFQAQQSAADDHRLCARAAPLENRRACRRDCGT